MRLRWDARKNRACNRASKRALGSKINYTMNPEDLKALKCVISLAALLSPD